ncbi:MAG: hypothetical protein PHI56_05000 [Victivallaceae bacterium]|nr:hypothetical protein [Victivallaceae bacterium]
MSGLYREFICELRRLKWLPGFSVFIITFLWFGFFALGDADAHHDGIMFKPAADMAAGQVLFRDSFTQYGLLTTWIQSIAIRIFGEQLIWVRFSAVFFYALSAVFLLKIWRAVLPGLWCFGVILLFWALPGFYLEKFCFLPWSSVYALFFFLLTAYFLLSAVRHDSMLSWVMAGCAGALTFWCRQPGGLALAAGGGLAILLTIWRPAALPDRCRFRILVFALSGFFFLLLPLLYLLINGAIEDWYIQSLRFAFRFEESKHQISVFDLFPILSVYGIFPLIMLAYSMIALIRVLRNKASSRDCFLLCLAAVSAASWFQYYPVGCERHLYWAGVPMFGFYVLMLFDLTLYKKHRVLVLVLLGIMAFFPLPEIIIRADGVLWYVETFSQRRSFKEGPLKGSFLFSEDYANWEKLSVLFAEVPVELQKKPYVNFTADALVCLYFPNRSNLHPMYVNWGDQVYDDYSEKIHRLILKYNPVVYNRASYRPPFSSRFMVLPEDDGKNFQYFDLSPNGQPFGVMR